MAIAQKNASGLSNSQVKLLGVLKKYAPTCTVDEIAPYYAAAMGKDEADPGSVTTAISVLRRTFKEAGKKFPAELEPQKKSGGGRVSERVDIAAALNELDFDFDSLEDVKKPAVTVKAEGEQNSGS